MARLAGGSEYLDAAIKQAANAKTLDELRMAQALLLPLKFGLSLDDAGVVLGVSKSWTLRLRKRFGRLQSGEEQPKTGKGLRNRARMTFDAEAALLAPYIEHAKQGGVVTVPPLKTQIEAALGCPPGVIDGVRDVAPPRLAQACARQTVPPIRSRGSRGMEKKLPENIEQAQKGFDHCAPLRLMFQDEARFGRISHTRYCRCPKPLRPLTQALVTQEYTYAYAAVSPVDGVLDTLILPSVNSVCMQVFLDEVARRAGG